MKDEIKIIQDEDGHFVEYDDTYDLTIHCTSQEEQDEVLMELNRTVCTDAISRQTAIDACLNGWNKDYKEIVEEIRALPPVTPQYTDTEIQKMQDLEFAEIQKAYEIGKEEGSEVLDKIRAEMEQIKEAEYQIYGKGSWRFVDKCLEIIDKYKASPTGEEVQDANSD